MSAQTLQTSPTYWLPPDMKEMASWQIWAQSLSSAMQRTISATCGSCRQDAAQWLQATTQAWQAAMQSWYSSYFSCDMDVLLVRIESRRVRAAMGLGRANVTRANSAVPFFPRPPHVPAMGPEAQPRTGRAAIAVQTCAMGDGGKVTVVGAGRVGSTFAYTLAASGLVREIVVVDADAARAEGEAMDIAHAVAFHPPAQVRAGALADAAGSIATVIAAGAAQQPGETRPQLMQRNAEALRRIVPEVVRANPAGLLLIATNPVDALTWVAVRTAGLPSARVLGSGTVLDSARLRSELSLRYRVDARNVHAYVLGEHGDSEFVAWSTAAVGNLPLAEYCAAAGLPCSDADKAAIAVRVRNAAYEIIRRKGATNFAIAAALTRIVEAIVRDEASVLTVSTLLRGEYGLDDICLSLPAIVGRQGVERLLQVPLAVGEVAALRRSAEAIRSAARALA